VSGCCGCNGAADFAVFSMHYVVHADRVAVVDGHLVGGVHGWSNR
jgi:hypothetical protein